MPSQHKQDKPLLEKILSKLVYDAETDFPNTVKKELTGGLTIYLRRSGDEYVKMLWRLNTYPSYQEWKTVCEYMPYKVPIIKPEKGVELGGYVLRGNIPVQVKRPVTQLEFDVFAPENTKKTGD